MSGYILCQIDRAKTPYYIEHVTLNIYSMEELCFYLYHNLYLLDQTILNEGLFDWLRDELGLRKLATRLYPLVDSNAAIADFIIPILKEINYLSLDEVRTLNENIAKYDAQPEIMRLKLKGDCLIGHEKYVHAIQIYQKTLSQTKHTHLGGQFTGSVYNNMGCAYMRLFQVEEAMECFRMAYEQMHVRASLKSYLFAYFLNSGREQYESKRMELGVDQKTCEELDQEIEQALAMRYQENPVGIAFKEAKELRLHGKVGAYPGCVDELLEKLTRDYHRNTGL